MNPEKFFRIALAVWSVAGFLGPGFAQDLQEEGAGAPEQPRLVLEAGELLERIEEDRAELGALREQRDAAQGEERQLFERRILTRGLTTLERVARLVGNVLEQEAQGMETARFRQGAEDLVIMLAPVFRNRIEGLQAEISRLGNLRETTTGNELIELEFQISRNDRTLDTIFTAALDNSDHMEKMGIGAATEEAYLARILTARAGTTAARVELAVEQISLLQGRLAETPDDAEIKLDLIAAETKRDRSTATLAMIVDMMGRIGLETDDYQRLLIEVTGQVTTDILDTGVIIGLFQQWLERLGVWIVESGPGLLFKALVFVFILYLFRLLSRVTRKVVRSAVSTSKLRFSLLFQNMFVSISGNMVLVIGLLVALSQLGFALGPILAGLGIAGFIIGFALQEVLGNFAAGMMILVYRPFDVGDMIEAAGVFGKVDAMTMVSTNILTIDNQTLIVPNGKIWGDVIKNVTAQKVRRVDMVFSISYTDDIPRTEKVLADILRDQGKVLDDPEPVVKLHNLGDSSVDFVVRPWVKTADYWEVYWNVTREVKMRFDREGISIPFPQRDIHYYEEKRIGKEPSPK